MKPGTCQICGDTEGHDGEPSKQHMHQGGYENDPTTRLLATHCAVCRRPLLDATSVELGIGPICRKRWMREPVELTGTGRTRANQLVHDIALTVSTGHLDLEVLKAACTELSLLGFTTLANKLLDGVVDIRITMEEGPFEDELVVVASYQEHAVAAFRTIPGRCWDQRRKVNIFPLDQKVALFQALCRCYPGAVGIGPKGIFVLPRANPADDAQEWRVR